MSISSRHLLIYFTFSMKNAFTLGWLHIRTQKVVSTSSIQQGHRLDFQSPMIFIIITVPHNLLAKLTSHCLYTSGRPLMDSLIPSQLVTEYLLVDILPFDIITFMA